MKEEVQFPTKEDIEVIALKKISERPNLSIEEARKLAYEELAGVLPKSFLESTSGRLNHVLDKT